MYLCLCKKKYTEFFQRRYVHSNLFKSLSPGVQMCTMGVGVGVNFHKGLYIPKNLLKINLLK